MKELRKELLFSQSKGSLGYDLLERFYYPWEALTHIGEYILEKGDTLNKKEYEKIGENIWISKEAKVAKSAEIIGPCIIGKGAEIRHCAFIRGNGIVGEGAVVGNSTEIKNSILFSFAQVPHYNYVGDSILGYKAHMGAGSITSNIKSDKSNVSIRIKEGTIHTGLRKMGAIIGDLVEVGCGCVLNPGTVIGENTTVYPLNSVRGYVQENSIYKGKGDIVRKKDLCAE